MLMTTGGTMHVRTSRTIARWLLQVLPVLAPDAGCPIPLLERRLPWSLRPWSLPVPRRELSKRARRSIAHRTRSLTPSLGYLPHHPIHTFVQSTCTPFDVAYSSTCANSRNSSPWRQSVPGSHSHSHSPRKPQGTESPAIPGSRALAMGSWPASSSGGGFSQTLLQCFSFALRPPRRRPANLQSSSGRSRCRYSTTTFTASATADSGQRTTVLAPAASQVGSRQVGYERSTATSLRGGRHLSDVPMTRLLLLLGGRKRYGSGRSAQCRQSRRQRPGTVTVSMHYAAAASPDRSVRSCRRPELRGVEKRTKPRDSTLRVSSGFPRARMPVWDSPSRCGYGSVGP
ncbi:hypothetical protein K466DRAFT_279082 [Polyporus arcularius HHB13444]|uniref:Uncharacterized protein n=1 Tax=Polyporus arcularius HHB13444 TaxID=1314778 RepID=A0A5C3PTH8_9APHY|nr:hypothetical protein K466DRAFT_279082 [Polyporus arcularius HHB13444]